MEVYTFIITVCYAALFLWAVQLVLEGNALKRKLGYPIPENALDKELYLVLSVTVHEDKVYYLLKGGSKIVTCWVNEKEGFNNFDCSSQEMLFLVPKNNS
jgi:hypothetical protein